MTNVQPLYHFVSYIYRSNKSELSTGWALYFYHLKVISVYKFNFVWACKANRQLSVSMAQQSNTVSHVTTSSTMPVCITSSFLAPKLINSSIGLSLVAPVKMDVGITLCCGSPCMILPIIKGNKLEGHLDGNPLPSKVHWNWRTSENQQQIWRMAGNGPNIARLVI